MRVQTKHKPTVGVLNKELDAHKIAPNLHQQLLFLNGVRIFPDTCLLAEIEDVLDGEAQFINGDYGKCRCFTADPYIQSVFDRRSSGGGGTPPPRVPGGL